MTFEITREEHVHGGAWEKQALGYFADPRMAKDYVAAIMRVARRVVPSVIVDLGGARVSYWNSS